MSEKSTEHLATSGDIPSRGGDPANVSYTKAVYSPHDPSMDDLCRNLSALASDYRTIDDWPSKSIDLCAQALVPRWFMPASLGGLGWSEADQIRGYLRLAAADLTTTFILTQFMGACKRIASSENPAPRTRYLDALLSGEMFATVGISHLTTSSRHLGRPVLEARAVEGGYRLEGMSPWVTGAASAQLLVIAATMDDARELMMVVPTDLPGVECGSGADLVALSASRTDRVTLRDVFVPEEYLLAGPVHGVMTPSTSQSHAAGPKIGSGAKMGSGTGGLQTSTLAAGLSRAAVDYLIAESAKRAELEPIASELDKQVADLEQRLIDAAECGSCDANEVRGIANRLVMKTTQAAMTAAKGAGFVSSHPVGRWCREALFFLVWSCPQPVAQNHLCELAGIE